MARVLIIDDDADSRRAMAELFASDDWNVLEAAMASRESNRHYTIVRN